ncbi:hypothetical protein Nizo1839_0460 [Lactiplantibacillus plantarum]|nr:hypothetical protein SF2A35B_1781 [Lactiplantibacillus plantarum]KZT83098.1 hypothetical protein Nizo1839_0460 [Lactiplantibacillus plantarum]
MNNMVAKSLAWINLKRTIFAVMVMSGAQSALFSKLNDH